MFQADFGSPRKNEGRIYYVKRNSRNTFTTAFKSFYARWDTSDRIVIADGNFPVESMGKDAIVVRCDGHGVPELLDAILTVIPLDSYVEKPVT